MSSAAGHVPAAAAAAPAKGYIVSPLYDGAFFVGAPVIAMAFTRALAASGSAWLAVFAIAFTHAHLFLVLFRSHGNPEIFKLHCVRFLVAPFARVRSKGSPRCRTRPRSTGSTCRCASTPGRRVSRRAPTSSGPACRRSCSARSWRRACA